MIQTTRLPGALHSCFARMGMAAIPDSDCTAHALSAKQHIGSAAWPDEHRVVRATSGFGCVFAFSGVYVATWEAVE